MMLHIYEILFREWDLQRVCGANLVISRKMRTKANTYTFIL